MASCPPRRIHIGHRVVDISVGGHDHLESMNSCRDAGLLGHFSWRRGLITLDGDMPPGETREILLHEVMHAISWCSGELLGTHMPEEDREEYVVRILTPYLLMVIRQNPDLMKYLSGDD